MSETARRAESLADRLNAVVLKRAEEIGRIGAFVLDLPSPVPGAQEWVGTRAMMEFFGIDDAFPKNGEGWLSLILEREEVAAYFDREVIGGHRPFDRCYQIRRPSDGQVRWIHGRGEVEVDERGARLIGTVQDVTEQRRAEDELKLRNALFSSQQETALDGILVIGEKGEVLNWNREFLRMWGLSPDALATGRDEKLLAEVLEQLRDPAAFRQKVEALYADHQARSHDELELRDGRLFDRYSAPVLGEDGRYFGRIWYFRDVTERRRAEEALRSSEASLRVLVDMAPVGITVLRDRAFLRVNPGLQRMTGYSEQELVGHSARMLYADEAEFQRVGKLLYGLEGYAETRFVRKGGAAFDVILRACLFDPGDPSKGIVSLCVDVSELREAEAKYRSILQGSMDGFAATDRDGHILEVNQAFCRMTRREAAELIGLRISDLPHSGGPPDPEAFFARVLAAGHDRFEVEHLLPGGETVAMEIVVQALRSPPALLHFVRDVSERKRAEHEKGLLQAQLAQAHKMESIGRLAGSIAHDFNNLLTAIIGNAELALLSLAGEEASYVESIKQAATSAAELTRQLLAFSRKQLANPRDTDLNEVVAKTLAMLTRLVGEDVVLSTTAQPGLPLVHVDPLQVQQVLMNLAVNARDAMPEGGRLTLETSTVVLDEVFCRAHAHPQDGEHVMLSVHDTGQGMSPEVLAHLYEPFFTTKAQGKGTGLGLATAYGIVKQNGGVIDVRSEVGKGTCFSVYFPARQGDARAAGLAAPASAAAGALPRGSETILLVEDNPMVLAYARRVLDVLGYRVLSAPSAEEALATAAATGVHIDLLLSDVILPGMNGRVLARALRANHPELPVLLCSGYTDTIPVAEEGLAGEYSFIAKPYTALSLARTLRQLLDAPRRRPSSPGRG